jgi:glucan phosphoethanolaminetransferase (alkaline phosphatase superfamily)
LRTGQVSSNNSSRRIASIAFASLIAILFVPNLAWFCYGPASFNVRAGAIMPTATLLVLFALFGKRLWAACLILIPFALLVPAETFYIARYGHPSTEEVFATVFATNSSEAHQFLGAALIPLVATTLLSLLVGIAATILAQRARLGWTHRSRSWVLTGALAVPVLLLGMGLASTPRADVSRIDAGLAAVQVLETPLEGSYPFGLVSRSLAYWREWREMVESYDALKGFRFGAKQHATVGHRQVYVMVLGESSARSHWQLYGYARPTTPELAKVDNLVRISDMLTSWDASVVAIPLALTRKPITDNALSWSEASIVRAMREAGYDTWWISNQLPFSLAGTPISAYALEAEHVLFLNASSDEVGQSYDEVVLRPLRSALEETSKDVFVVLHTMGSHSFYYSRYPQAFGRFQPDHTEGNIGVVNGEMLVNSYDNTIVYTDHLLAATIQMLKGTDAITALWYESDHGETLPNGNCQVAGHGADSRDEFEIPAVFWYSDHYAAAFPDRVANIRAHAGERTLSGNTFESLVDMAGVDFPSHDGTWSLFNPYWQYHPRMVNPMRADPVDFDSAVFDEKCSVPTAPDKRSTMR